jgi:hypothetical protein
MDWLRQAFSDAANRLKNRTIALVYAHSFDQELLSAYYLRQRTEVLSGYADVIDLLGANPVFYNIDQFVELCTRSNQMKAIDYIINVPGGSLDIDLTTLVSNLARKIKRPIFPASPGSIFLGQNKPIARRIAHDLGWPVPASISVDQARTFRGAIIRKPKYGGDSYGVGKVGYDDILKFADNDKYMLEEFIEGYDLTTYVIRSAVTKRHEVLASSLTIPPEESDRNWFWDHDTKDRSSGRGTQRFVQISVRREPRRTSSPFDQLCRETCEVFGVFSVARIDFRLTDRQFDDCSEIDVGQCRFLEINVLPTISTSGSWQHHIKRHLENYRLAEADIHAFMPMLPPMQAAMLYIFLSWIVQRADGSATGVDQLK